MRKLIAFYALSLTSFSSVAMAEESSTWQHCGLSNGVKFMPNIDSSEQTDRGVVDIKSDDAQLVRDGTSVFTGDVEILQDGKEFTGERATYNETTGRLTSTSDMQVRDSDMLLKAKQAEWSVFRDEGTLLDSQYFLREMHARGESKYAHRVGRARTDLKSATYTTCNVNSNAWSLDASEIYLDHTEAVGEAKNVVLRVADVPVFYTPYINFPLNDERKSGFLIPSIGSSDESGFDLQTPYYWNIAPNRDATITPRYMSDRGVMLRGEYRYKYKDGEGKVDAGFLASDDLDDDGDDANPFYNEDRKHFSLQHKSDFGNNWYSNVDYNYVSDDDYLEDFSDGLSLSSTSFLRRQWNVGYSASNWQFIGRLQGFQNLNDESKPYQRLPQLLFKGTLPEQKFGLHYDWHAEYVDFHNDDRVDGQRVDIEPAVSFPITTTASYLTPRVALKHTRYDLKNTDKSATVDDDKPTRTLPIVSVDSGLIFEKPLKFSGGDYTQTLEPRAYYLYVPERDQSDLPTFDSNIKSFNMTRLFSDNRFSGTDRVGDANQVSVGFTTRFLEDQTGRESLNFSLGQTYYFEDRDVAVPNVSKGTISESDMIAEVQSDFTDNWLARGQIQWNPYAKSNNMSSLEVRYRGDEGSLFNLAHRYRRDGVQRDDVSPLEGLEQIDVSAAWPVTPEWNLIGRYYHSIKESQMLEGLAGVEYDSCCWASRVVLRNYINDIDDDDERNVALMFQFELKGLGNFGQRADTVLKHSILGYDQEDDY